MNSQEIAHKNRPEIIACIGLHSSASTWVYNITRELMVSAFGEQNIEAKFYDRSAAPVLNQLAPGQYAVTKAYCASPQLKSLLWISNAPIILSVRDPRDSIVSLMQRSGTTFEHALYTISKDCEFAQELADANCLLLRYEDSFYCDPEKVALIAQFLQIDREENDILRTFSKYTTT